MAGPSADDGSPYDELTGTDRLLVSGIVWTAVFRWVSQALSWISTLYVARILKPADYGLVADLYTALPELAAELGKLGR